MVSIKDFLLAALQQIVAFMLWSCVAARWARHDTALLFMYWPCVAVAVLLVELVPTHMVVMVASLVLLDWAGFHMFA